MSLRFYIGASGSGKTGRMEEDMTALAIKDIDRQFIYIVPDQFTLQTQKEMVEKSPRKGIMNIDVQSFGRLMHRINDEVGGTDRLILDDTGKNLILRKAAFEISGELKVIGKNFKRTGYVHEVKSVLSEFEQYGLKSADLDKLIDGTSSKPLLNGKLKDLKLVYEKMEEFCRERYITKEEKMDVLAEGIYRSQALKGAVVALDGFTGFTPVQDKVLKALLMTCAEVWVSIILPAEEYEDYLADNDEHRLFAMSMKTMGKLRQLAKDCGCRVEEPVFLYGDPVKRYETNPGLSALERNLFREKRKSAVKAENIKLFRAKDPETELREIFLRILELSLKEGYAYKDIAVAVSNMETYADFAESLAETYGIPVFTDYSRKLMMTPFTEFITSVLETVVSDLSYESVMHFAKSGMAPLTDDEICTLDNYLFATGIRGYKKYCEPFTRLPRYVKKRYPESERQAEYLKAVNDIRVKITEILAPFTEYKKGGDAAEISERIYELMLKADCAGKLGAFAKKAAVRGDIVREKEYEQLYRYICGLLEQIHSLLNGSFMELSEYLEILKAGIEEISVGVLPMDIDRVVIGDMQRTRFKPVKILFAAGFNSDLVPGTNSSGGMISDMDREYLGSLGFELAPTPRQKMFMQRLYIYHVLTRPSEQLIVSYSALNREGASIRPSYVLSHIKNIFTDLVTEYAEDRKGLLLMPAGRGDANLLPVFLSEAAAGSIDTDNEKLLAVLVHRKKETDPEGLLELMEAAYGAYVSNPLSKRALYYLYGNGLITSISSLSRMASCPYSYYLAYGMRLEERENAGFNVMDIGNIYHDALRILDGKLNALNIDWADIPEDMLDSLVEESLLTAQGAYGTDMLYADKRTAYQAVRMKRILTTGVQALSFQFGKSTFRPFAHELPFKREIGKEGELKVFLNGRIDRLDTSSSPDGMLLKVVDYKSGKKDINMDELYYGTQLQLPVYLNEGLKILKERFPGQNIIPAALFYFTIRDPYVEAKEGLIPGDEEVKRMILSELKPSGYFSQKESVLDALDRNIKTAGVSEAVNYKQKSDGTVRAGINILSEDEMDALLSFTEKKIEGLAGEICDGNISVSPLGDACKYCKGAEICPFDSSVKGFKKRKKDIKASSAKEIICTGGAE